MGRAVAIARLGRRVVLTVGVLVIVAISAWVYRLAEDRSASETRDRLGEIARLEAQQIDTDLRRWAELISSMGTLDLGRLDEETFTEFVDVALGDRDADGRLIGTYRGMTSVVWVPAPVPDEPEPAYTVAFARPDSLSLELVGADLGELPGRVQGLERSANSGEPTIVGFFVPTIELELPAEEQSQLGSIYVPMYAGGIAPATIGDRRASLVGWAVAGFRASELFERFDGNDGLSFSIAADGDVEYTSAAIDDELTASASVAAFDRRWRLTVAGTPSLVDPTGLADPRYATVAAAALGTVALIAIDALLRVRVTGLGRLLKVEKRAAAAERTWRHLADEVSAGLIEVDTAGVIRFANGLGGYILGIERTLLEGRTFSDVMSICCTDATPGHLVATCVAAGESVDVELRTGDRLHLATTSAPGGGALITIEDVTAERRAIDELSAALSASARQREQSRRLIATMSHEVRTPLAGIVGLSKLAIDSGKIDPATGDVMRQMHEVSVDLLDIVNNALAVSVSDSGALRLSPGPIRIERFLNDLTSSMAPDLASDVDLVVEVADVDTVAVDSSRLRQLVGNLISNAIAHTTSGSVKVLVERADGDLLRIVVSDTGSGIPNDDQAQVFEPFFQSGRGNQRAGGAGLGLAVVRSVATAMGGTIALVSEVGVGSRFTLELPAPDADLVAASDGVDSEAVDRVAEGLSVVVVDDDAISTEVASRLFAHLGASVTAIADGPSALRHMSDCDADVVVIDLHLPEVEGFAILATALSTRKRTGAPRLVLAATASTAAEDHLRCRDLGVDGVLLKPLDRSTVLGLIKPVLTASAVPSAVPSSSASAIPSASVPQASDGNMIDERIEELIELGVFADIVALARTQIPALAQELRGTAVDARHRRLAAHTLAGTLRSLGARELADEIDGLRPELGEEPDAPMRARLDALISEAHGVLERASVRASMI